MGKPVVCTCTESSCSLFCSCFAYQTQIDKLLLRPTSTFLLNTSSSCSSTYCCLLYLHRLAATAVWIVLSSFLRLQAYPSSHFSYVRTRGTAVFVLSSSLCSRHCIFSFLGSCYYCGCVPVFPVIRVPKPPVRGPTTGFTIVRT